MRQTTRHLSGTRRMSEHTVRSTTRRRQSTRSAARASIASTCNHSATMMGDVATTEPFLSVTTSANPPPTVSDGTNDGRPSLDASNNASRRVLRSRRLSGPVTRSCSRSSRIHSGPNTSGTRKRGRSMSVSRSRSKSTAKRPRRQHRSAASHSQPAESTSTQTITAEVTVQSTQQAESPDASNQQEPEQGRTEDRSSQNQCCSALLSETSSCGLFTSQNKRNTADLYSSWTHRTSSSRHEEQSISSTPQHPAYSLPSLDPYDVEDSQDSDEQEVEEASYNENQNAATEEQESTRVSEIELPQDSVGLSGDERFFSSYSTREDSIS